MRLPIAEERELSHARFACEYLVPHVPVVVRGYAENWRAVRSWTPETLARRAGDRKLAFPLDQVDQRYGRIGVADYINALSREDAAALPYMRNVTLPPQWPELLADLEQVIYATPNWLEIEPLRSTIAQIIPHWTHWIDLFVSGPETRFPTVHIDVGNTHAWFVQVYGTKRFWAWPPEPGVHGVDCMSRALETILPHSPPRVCEIGPGDFFFMPATWLHTAESTSVSLTLSGNFVNASNWDAFAPFLADKMLHRALQAAAPLPR